MGWGERAESKDGRRWRGREMQVVRERLSHSAGHPFDEVRATRVLGEGEWDGAELDGDGARWAGWRVAWVVKCTLVVSGYSVVRSRACACRWARSFARGDPATKSDEREMEPRGAKAMECEETVFCSRRREYQLHSEM